MLLYNVDNMIYNILSITEMPASQFPQNILKLVKYLPILLNRAFCAKFQEDWNLWSIGTDAHIFCCWYWTVLITVFPSLQILIYDKSTF